MQAKMQLVAHLPDDHDYVHKIISIVTAEGGHTEAVELLFDLAPCPLVVHTGWKLEGFASSRSREVQSAASWSNCSLQSTTGACTDFDNGLSDKIAPGILNAAPELQNIYHTILTRDASYSIPHWIIQQIEIRTLEGVHVSEMEVLGARDHGEIAQRSIDFSRSLSQSQLLLELDVEAADGTMLNITG